MRVDVERMIKDRAPGTYAVEIDRRRAIEIAVRASGAGDCILVAGKGHESYQITGTKKSHFSDTEELRKVLDG